VGKTLGAPLFAPDGYAVRGILRACGYDESVPHGGSSHHTFRKQGRMPITIPVHGKIKRVYVELVKEAVEKEREQK